MTLDNSASLSAELRLIKGGGGILLREKLTATASRGAGWGAGAESAIRGWLAMGCLRDRVRTVFWSGSWWSVGVKRELMMAESIHIIAVVGSGYKDRM